MDIHCVKCGEPWDIDSLHDEAEDRAVDNLNVRDKSYDQIFSLVREDFFTRGCPALKGTCSSVPDLDRAAVSGAMHDLLGDDIDGIASMMEDFG